MPSKNESDAIFIASLKDIVDRNLDNTGFSIQFLCREARLSRTQLHRKVKSATGLSTSLFVRKCRLEKGRQLLETSDLNISEVAYRVGSSNPQNFSQYFAKEFGLSPSAYRKNWKASKENPEPTNWTPIHVSKSGGQRFLDYLVDRQTIFLMMAIAAGICIAIWFWKSSHILSPNNSIPPNPEAKYSIAVIPFNFIGANEHAYLSEGIVEDIITHLAKFKSLKVISRTSSAQYKDTKLDIKQIATELNVTFVLEGSVRHHNDRGRINAQLVRASDDHALWSNSYDYETVNIIGLQGTIAEEIAGALNQNISPEIKIQFEEVPTSNLEAYNALLRGRYLLQGRTKEGIEQSIIQFDEALNWDPHCSEAFTGKAAAYNILVDLNYAPDGKEKEFIQTAEQNALLAIKENGRNALAYAILGNIYREQYRWKEAITSYKIALEINPNDALANYWYSLVLRETGDLSRALMFHRTACDLDPLYPVIHAGRIYTLSIAGKYNMAEELIKNGEPVFKNSFLWPYVTGLNLMLQQKFDQAIPYFEQALSMNPGYWSAERNKAYCEGKLGNTRVVNDYLSILNVENTRDNLSASFVWMSLGEFQKSLELLEKAASLHHLPEDLLVHPVYDKLHQNPRFIQILNQFELDEFLPVEPLQ